MRSKRHKKVSQVSPLQVEKEIGYSFTDKNLLEQALIHSSFAYEHQEKKISDNEVLEFLGDSVVGLIVADYFYQLYPNLSEGELSKLKSFAASTSSLSQLAKNIGLDKAISLGKGEEKSGGRRKATILAGAFEALIGAVYLDGGFEEAKRILCHLLHSFFKEITAEKFLLDNYKSALQELLQKENLPGPSYRIVSARGPEHKKTFTVEVVFNNIPLARAKGSSKKSAEQKAAEKAWKLFVKKGIKVLDHETFVMKK